MLQLISMPWSLRELILRAEQSQRPMLEAELRGWGKWQLLEKCLALGWDWPQLLHPLL